MVGVHRKDRVVCLTDQNCEVVWSWTEIFGEWCVFVNQKGCRKAETGVVLRAGHTG